MLTKGSVQIICGLLVLMAAAVPGCTTARSTTGNDWHEFRQVYTVKEKLDFTQTRTLGFGPYRSSAVRVNAKVTGHQWQVIPVNHTLPGTQKLEELSFRMSGNRGLAASVYCVNRVPLRRFASRAEHPQYYDLMRPVITDAYHGEIFATEIVGEGSEDNWKMMIASNIILSKTKRIAGYLIRDADNYYAIMPVFIKDNSSPGAKSWRLPGYRFTNRADQLVAEISLLKKPSVSLGHLAENEKFLLANASAAILINHFSQL